MSVYRFRGTVGAVAMLAILLASAVASVAADQSPLRDSAPDFTLNCTPGQFSVPKGGMANGSCALMSTGNFAGPVFLTCLGAPPGIDCSFLPDPVNLPPNGPGFSDLAIAVNLTTNPGTYTFAVEGRAGPLAHTSPLQVIVPTPGYSFTCAPPFLSIPQWDLGEAQCDVSPLDGFAGQVHLACVPPLGGISCSIENETVIVPPMNGSRIIFYIPFYHATGLVNLTLQALNGTTVRNATIAVNVTKSTKHEIPGILPLDQHDPRVSNNTTFQDSACAPTAEAMALIAVGFRKDQNGDGKFDEDDMYIIVQKIATAKKTTAENGTTAQNEETGIKKFITDSGEGDNFTEASYPANFATINASVGKDVPVVLVLERKNADGDAFRHKLIVKDVNYTKNADGTNTISLVDPWDDSNLTTKWSPKGPRILYDADSDGKVDVVNVLAVEIIERKSGLLRVDLLPVEWMSGRVFVFENGTSYVIEAPIYGKVYVQAGIVYGLPPGGKLWAVNGTATAWANGSVEIDGVKSAVPYDVFITDGDALVNSSAHWRYSSMPLNFNYSSSGADVTLSWDAPMYARGGVVEYRVFRVDPSGFVTTFTTPATDYIDTPPGLDDYNYSVAAVNGNGTGLATDELMVHAGLPASVGPWAALALIVAGAALLGRTRGKRRTSYPGASDI